MSASARAPETSARLVVAGGTVTEIVFALGLGDRVVALDTSSVFPAEAAKGRASIGYQRTLAAEGIIAQRPSLVVVSSDAGPPAAIEQLKSAGTRLEVIGGGNDFAGVEERIRGVARAVGAETRGAELIEKVRKEHAAALAFVGQARTKPRVLFVYARGPGTLMVGGRGTPADAMIRFAGAINAIDGFEGFRPLTAEAVSGAAPDVILVPSRGLESLGSVDALLGQPGMSATPAGTSRRVVAMDDLLLLGFGPRIGAAVKELGTRLHPDLEESKP